MMVPVEKPPFLYHGSRYELRIIEPRQAFGSPEEHGAECGVYAYPGYEMALPFALTIEPFGNGSMAIYIDDETGHVTISAGTLDENAPGFVYRVPSDAFEPLDGRQWLARVPVVPVEVFRVRSQDYMDKVTFTGAALAARVQTGCARA